MSSAQQWRLAHRRYDPGGGLRAHCGLSAASLACWSAGHSETNGVLGGTL